MPEDALPDVGQRARFPNEMPPRAWWQIAKRMGGRVAANRLGLVSAGVAFFGLLAVFPAITALVATGGLFIDPDRIAEQIDPLLASLPEAAAEILRGQLTSLSLFDNESLGLTAILSIAIAFFSASRGTMNLIAGLNVAYDEVEQRGFFLLQAWGIAMTIAAILGVIATILIVAALPAAVAVLTSSSVLTEVALALRWPILFVAAVFGFSVLYRFGPSRRSPRWRWIRPGAVAAVVFWVVATFLFSFYVREFGRYNETFGTLAGAITLMLWLWLTSFVVLFGAMLDAEIEAQTAADTTVGPDRPMGERGAVKADTCAAVVPGQDEDLDEAEEDLPQVSAAPEDPGSSRS